VRASDCLGVEPWIAAVVERSRRGNRRIAAGRQRDAADYRAARGRDRSTGSLIDSAEVTSLDEILRAAVLEQYQTWLLASRFERVALSCLGR
jgi:hypothetical protein